MKIALDSSALFKAYFREHGSDRVESMLSTATDVIVSIIAGIEIVAALNRVRREGKLSDESYGRIRQALHADWLTFRIIPFDIEITNRAVILLERFPLRSADALHIASAEFAAADIFLSSDKQQIAAAGKAGLSVMNPCDD